MIMMLCVKTQSMLHANSSTQSHQATTRDIVPFWRRPVCAARLPIRSGVQTASTHREKATPSQPLRCPHLPHFFGRRRMRWCRMQMRSVSSIVMNLLRTPMIHPSGNGIFSCYPTMLTLREPSSQLFWCRIAVHFIQALDRLFVGHSSQRTLPFALRQ